MASAAEWRRRLDAARGIARKQNKSMLKAYSLKVEGASKLSRRSRPMDGIYGLGTLCRASASSVSASSWSTSGATSDSLERV